MRFREWLRGHAQPPEAGVPPSPDELQRLRQMSRELLMAGEAAINKALSANSEEFLQATRQEGGE